ncbi:hypothetical protein Zm00014a_019866 [Zea mays]|uniref:BRCT domain-containing protein n=3 Tax=Zea mays TaxID=4577 RepID=A0A979HLJ0_MAIZE|nr:BRCT domain-containing protein At4g02110 [Zea mays]ONM61025.1 BRCT domain-containing protein [Zea mays]PWZ15904.1 BRCT domain-containing protein [Zea mays]PWZ15906.1 hypothetical protein Zm00014a_019866 [Zea mays]|eukprot:NP_001339373.1 uncharacterized protein LOC100216554 [Zea mays]
MPPHGPEEDAADAHLFAGVRFALHGFDQISASQFRLEIERCGGVHAGGWDADCTHVIVSNTLYDDPVCVAARKAGKKVVVDQWVEDSFDLGELADADRVLYAPVRDFKGIPGCDKLHICLTGYQKNWRDDIMKMVSLMGANFSKSLAANIITHLICYKFEGEKYELAKRVNIKLVNHRWLEECLKAWEILPVDHYTKSGWEVEIMGAQAKDSEDETEYAGTCSLSSRRIDRRTPIREISTKSHVDSALHAPSGGPTVSASNVVGATGKHLSTPEQFMKAHDASTKSSDIRTDSGTAPDTKCAAMSVDNDTLKPTRSHIYHNENDEVPADKASRDEAKDDHRRELDTRDSTLRTPSVHKSIAPTIPGDNIENTNRNCFHGFSQINVNSDLQLNSSEENFSKKILHSTNLSRKVDQKDDGHVPDPKPNISQSSVEENLNMCEFNPRSEGNSASRNDQPLGYSRRRSSKSGSLNVHRKKSILSSVSSKAPNEAPDSGSGISSATASDVGRSPTEPTKVDGHVNSGPTMNSTENQMSGCKSNLLSYRRTSLKLVSSAEVEKLPENSVNDKNMVEPDVVKTPALHEATTEEPSPSVCSEVRKESLGVHQNRDAEMTDAQLLSKTEDAAPCSKPDKVVSCQNSGLEGCKDVPVNKITDEHGIFPSKISTSRVKKVGAKRSRNAGSKAASEFTNSRSEVAALKPKHDKVASHENVEAQQGEGCCSPNAAECTPPSPAEALNNKSTNEVLTSSQGPNHKTNESLVASKAESVNMTLQRNKKGNRRKLPNTSNADENQRSSSRTVPNSKSGNLVAKGSRTADFNISDSPTVDETETVPSNSSFNEAVPPGNGEEKHKRLSSSANADDPEACTANKVPNNRVRKVVAKRKLSDVQSHKSGSEPCKTAKVLVSEVKVVSPARVAQSSRNANKVTVVQDLQNTNTGRTNDTVGSFCKDVTEDCSKDMQSSKTRSSRRQKIADLVDGSTDHDKENILVDSNFTSNTKRGNNSMSSKSNTKTLQSSKAVLDESSVIKRNGYGTLDVPEPTWFILSGHRLLRKEYRAILRRLRGRVCRDSHHWSFQATHLVTTEMRRTEKFFAAAAAGRWILKPDYLTASNEAGKFLEEEPFEWHGEGLNIGDTISLDAPRKWRQLRQRTGYGAFYGMQVIIYGECIAPTLDTLKRAIRCGDGTILATSPPYTRFFKSSVDFAVVSAGMPSADAWVQEFMRHSIPCISADYLVEYVCKPGHPLGKHVLFNMHDLAERSLQKLMKNQEDAPGSCSACGSDNREVPMLVCGGDGRSQSSGCGVRTHADCCNPPVEGCDGGEWLCGRCDQQKSAKKAKKTAAKPRVLKQR